LFNGKCQVIILAGKTAGAIKFEAKSEGLYTGSTDIFTISPSVSQITGSKNASASNKKTGKIWEPLNTWEKIFDEKGNSNDLILEYDSISKSF